MKKNNDSLVELIVVVLIMAIIATALTHLQLQSICKVKEASDVNTRVSLLQQHRQPLHRFYRNGGTLIQQILHMTLRQKSGLEQVMKHLRVIYRCSKADKILAKVNSNNGF